MSGHSKPRPFSIIYDIGKIKTLGSIGALVLEERLLFYFEKEGDSFEKFISPCKHPDYKEGTSWEEELGVSKKRFRNAFDKIGRRYISKTAFEKEDDPFKGRRFAYYQERKSNKTVFVKKTA